MTAHWVEFTFGNMYKGVPGFIESLSYSVPDNAPYETDTFQLPKVIEATMGFKYVGNHLQTMQGKHFDLPWLQGTENTVVDIAQADKAAGKLDFSQPDRSDFFNKALSEAWVKTLPKQAAPKVEGS